MELYKRIVTATDTRYDIYTDGEYYYYQYYLKVGKTFIPFFPLQGKFSLNDLERLFLYAPFTHEKGVIPLG